MVEAPHAMYPGTDEQSYYRGEVTAAAPGTVRQEPTSRAEQWPTGREPVDETDALAAASSLRDPSAAHHGEAPHERGRGRGGKTPPEVSS
jgi:NADH-quinone oxidoreductase subunit I